MITIISDKMRKEICERLYVKELANIRNCPDCGVAPDEQHEEECDVARCENCGVQSLMCSCGNTENTIWTGLWPGIQECYEQQLIYYDTNPHSNLGWTFDLNEASKKLQNKQNNSLKMELNFTFNNKTVKLSIDKIERTKFDINEKDDLYDTIFKEIEAKNIYSDEEIIEISDMEDEEFEQCIEYLTQ